MYKVLVLLRILIHGPRLKASVMLRISAGMNSQHLQVNRYYKCKIYIINTAYESARTLTSPISHLHIYISSPSPSSPPLSSFSIVYSPQSLSFFAHPFLFTLLIVPSSLSHLFPDHPTRIFPSIFKSLFFLFTF